MITPATTSEVLIVGGGPAGSTCAWKLRERGVDAQILDRATFPRDKVCAGWITPEVIESLQLAPNDYHQDYVLQLIRSFRVGVLNRRTHRKQRRADESPDLVRVDYDKPVSYGIRRCEFDEYLLRRCGVPVQEGVRIRSLERDDGTWFVNGEFRARLLIGAGGHFCPIARRLHSKSDVADSQPVVVAQEAEFELRGSASRECRIESGVPELFFYPDLKGYAWCFRKENWLNIGLGREGEQHLSHWRDDLVDWLLETGRIAQAPDVPFKGHAYRLNMKTSLPVAGDGILLIGDSAGLADAHSGEGIRPAIESALLAADSIAETDDIEEAAITYGQKLRQQLPGDSAGLPSLIPSTVRTWLARHMLRNKRFVRRVVLDDWFLNRVRTSVSPLRSGTS